MTLLDEMAARVASEGLVTTGFRLCVAIVPASPNAVIVLSESGGAPPDILFGGDTTEQPGLQVIVRGAPNDYVGPRAAIETLHRAICGWGAFSVSGTRYIGLIPLQQPFPLRIDDNDRQELAVNYLVQKEPS